MWITINDRSPRMLRALKIEMFWDNEVKPAVSVPFGDFFGVGLGKTTAFENALFSNAEGRSFVCLVPMTYRKAAKIIVKNESGETIRHIFFDVDYNLINAWNDDHLYFHAYWHRDTATALAKDFELLPQVHGKGRFLGVNIGINANPLYKDSWWGEGEVKIYLDGDSKYPTINGTGSEDYLGSAWGLGKFVNRYQGCTIASDSTREYNFYRWHVPDAIYFNKDIRVVIQQIGGGMSTEVQQLFKKGVKLQPVSVAKNDGFLRLFEMQNPPSLHDNNFPVGWVNFYRIDDYSSVSYFYIDKPANNLPVLPTVSERVKNVK